MEKVIIRPSNYVTLARGESTRERLRGFFMREWGGTGGEVLRQWTRAAAGVLLLVAAVDGCSGSGSGGGGSVNIANSQSTDPATVNYPIFYVKRTVPTDTAGNLVQDDLRVMRDLVPQVDLYERASASRARSKPTSPAASPPVRSTTSRTSTCPPMAARCCSPCAARSP